MYGICVVWGEPLSQTAQSFMPELLYGLKPSLEKVSNIQILLLYFMSKSENLSNFNVVLEIHA